MIPTFLHQYWDNIEPPASVQRLLATWAGMNEGWSYRLWNDGTIVEFIDEHLGSNFLKAFESCKFPAMRADLARYALLWKIGGVYADADLTCLTPLDSVIDKEASLVLFRGWNGAWRNDFMAASPGCPVVGEIIAAAVENIASRYSPHNLWLVTGPGMTTPIIEKAVLSGTLKIQTFSFNEVKGKILTFNHDLDYRAGDKHWSIAQQSELIYRD